MPMCPVPKLDLLGTVHNDRKSNTKTNNITERSAVSVTFGVFIDENKSQPETKHQPIDHHDPSTSAILPDAHHTPKSKTISKVQKQSRYHPPQVHPLYMQKWVLLKIGDHFLRIGNRHKPVTSTQVPPLTPPLADAGLDELLDPTGAPKTRHPFDFSDFIFVADETASVTESWYKSTRSFFHIRLGVKREGRSGPSEYLCSFKDDLSPLVQYDSISPDCWWRLTAVGSGRFLAESLTPPGLTLQEGGMGLELGPPLTAREWGGVVKGHLNKARTLTIMAVPDFAIFERGVCVD